MCTKTIDLIEMNGYSVGGLTVVVEVGVKGEHFTVSGGIAEWKTG